MRQLVVDSELRPPVIDFKLRQKNRRPVEQMLMLLILLEYVYILAASYGTVAAIFESFVILKKLAKAHNFDPSPCLMGG